MVKSVKSVKSVKYWKYTKLNSLNLNIVNQMDEWNLTSHVKNPLNLPSSLPQENLPWMGPAAWSSHCQLPVPCCWTRPSSSRWACQGAESEAAPDVASSENEKTTSYGPVMAILKGKERLTIKFWGTYIFFQTNPRIWSYLMGFNMIWGTCHRCSSLSQSPDWKNEPVNGNLAARSRQLVSQPCNRT